MPNSRKLARQPLRALLVVALAAAIDVLPPFGAAPALSMAPAVSGATTAASTEAATAPTLAQLVGQKLVVAMEGTTPSTSLLGRVKRGEVGGVILFGSNIGSAADLLATTKALRAAAAAGGQPAPLIATDQEGGPVKRVPWAPPTLSPSQMAADGRSATAYAQGRTTGRVLNCAGINSDLAPVADVPASTSSFIYRQGRAWSFSASVTASLADAFGRGLVAGLDVPAMKHFPGLGHATQNTDSGVVKITASKAELAPGLLPYKTAIAHGIPIVMLSNATYTAYDAANAAGWSHAISVGLLRGTLGFKGVTITDSLTGTATARGVSPSSLAIRAATAGTDMLLLTGSEADSAGVYADLLAAAHAGTVPLATLRTSYTRILAIKARLRSPSPDTKPPVVGKLSSTLYAPVTLGRATTPVQTSWSATDPCAVSADTLWRQTNGQSAQQTLSSPTATSIRQSLAFSTTYRYAANATDGAGNTSAWRYGAALVPIVTQQSDPAVTLAGSWHTAAVTDASGGSLAYSATRGASATFRFTGTSVSWVAARGPGRGSVAVYVDGTYRATISLASTVYRARQVVFATSWTTAGAHTLRIVNLGTARHPRVDVDAFVRLTSP